MNAPNDTTLPAIDRVKGGETNWEALSLYSKSLLTHEPPNEETFRSVKHYIDSPLPFLLKALDYLVNEEENQTIFLTNTLAEANLYFHLLEALAIPLSYEIAYPHHQASTPKKNHIIIFPAINYTLTAYKDFKWEEVKFLLFDYPSLIKVNPNSPVNELFKFLLQEPTPSPLAKELISDENQTTLLTTLELIPLNMSFLTPLKNQPPLGQEQDYSQYASRQTEPEQGGDKQEEERRERQKQPIRLNKQEKNHHEIAFIRKNFERQYIRNLIRRESLTQVIIVVQSRQFAKQLSNYLYRARIQSRIMHQGMDEKIKQKFIDRFNYGNVSALIISLDELSLLEGHLPQVQKVIFYQHPATYLEFEEELLTIYQALTPLTTLSLADENEKAWVEDLKNACHHFIIEIARTQSAKSHSSHKKEGALLYKRRKRPTRPHNPPQTAFKDDSPQNDDPLQEKESQEDQQEKPPVRAQAGARGRAAERKNIRVKTVTKKRSSSSKRQPSTHEEANNTDSPLTIVNQNRLPFGSESFEAHIAKANRARLKKVYANQHKPNHQDYTALFTQEVEDSTFNPLKLKKKPNHNNNKKRTHRRPTNKKK